MPRLGIPATMPTDLGQGGGAAPPIGVETVQQHGHHQRRRLARQTADQDAGQFLAPHVAGNERQGQQAPGGAIPHIDGAAHQLAQSQAQRIGRRQALNVPGPLGHFVGEGFGGQPGPPQQQQEIKGVTQPFLQVGRADQMQTGQHQTQQHRHQHQTGGRQFQPQATL